MTDARLVEAHQHVSLMQSLEANAGWKMLVEIIQEQSSEMSLVLEPLRSNEELYAQEFRKGEIKRAQTILALPAALVEAAQGIIEAFTDEDEEDGEAS